MGIDQPFIVILSSANNVCFDPLTRFRGGLYRCRIKGTGHTDFWEGPLAWNLLSLAGEYPIMSSSDDPVRIVRVYSDYTLAFFDKHLKGRRVPLLEGSSPVYPEVEFTIFGEL